MNYDKLTDRELDALVAEKVMGLDVLPSWEHCWSAETDLDCVGRNETMGSELHPVYVDDVDLECHLTDTKLQGYPITAICAVPRYSASIGDVFQVVEAMRERHPTWGIQMVRTSASRDWIVKIAKVGHMFDWSSPDNLSGGESLPRTICIAALMACEE